MKNKSVTVVYTISVAHAHIPIMGEYTDDKEVWSPPIEAHMTLEGAKGRIEDSRSDIQEWSRWLEYVFNEENIIHFVYVTFNWADGKKSFKTWRIDEMKLKK